MRKNNKKDRAGERREKSEKEGAEGGKWERREK